MKTITLDIIKKNRVYFACKTENGYACKLKIDEKSENLALGKNTLVVNDISVKSKYGVDIIYELYATETVSEMGICTLKHRYNLHLTEKCRELGGKWDGQEKVWIFPKIVEDKIEELDERYNSNIVNVEITAKGDKWGYQDAVYFKGYPLARAWGRDSGAKVCENVCMVRGKINSGGSMKNWGTDVASGTIFRLEISKNLLKNLTEDMLEKWDIKILN